MDADTHVKEKINLAVVFIRFIYIIIYIRNIRSWFVAALKLFAVAQQRGGAAAEGRGSW